MTVDVRVVHGSGDAVGAGDGGVGGARRGDGGDGQGQGERENAQGCDESLLHVRYSSTCSGWILPSAH